MLTINKKSMCSLVIFLAWFNHTICSVGEDVALNAGLPAAKVVSETLKDPKVGENLGKAGADFGEKFGLQTIQTIGAGIAAASAAITKAGVAIKASAIAVAAAPATPCILFGVGVIAVSYGGHKMYRYYNPTPEQIAIAKKIELDIAQTQSKLDTLKTEAEKLKKETELKESLQRNAHSSERNAQGIPLVCQKEALNLAIVAGSKRVEKIVDSFQKYAPTVAA
jgi:hypothetical protein